ncbi:MAG: hypothetical protein IT458_04605 [Planctomycetes bacterium]|nr:hypothetical protein [Planctomycetota bacterium]
MNRPTTLARRANLKLVLMSGVLTLGACAPAEYVTIPFEYLSMAAGNEGVRDVVVLRPGDEQRAVSDALFLAVQTLEHGIVKPEVAAGAMLPTGEVLETGFVKLSPEIIEQHNKASATAKLPPDRLYRLSYRVEYSIGDRRIDLRVWPHLQQRGSGGEWRDDTPDYSGRFFTDRLRGEIERSLKQARGQR